MSKAYVTSAVAGAFLLGMATTALAVTGEYDNSARWGSRWARTYRPTAPSMGRLEARPIASAAKKRRPPS